MPKGFGPQTTRRRMLLGGAAVLGLSASGLLARAPGIRQAAAEEVDLESFLVLSRSLTGHGDLDPHVGAIYLNALLQSPDKAAELKTLLAAPADDGAASELAAEIVTQWYTGIYESGGTQITAAYQGALMWRAMSFTPPPGDCQGAFGFWSRPPEL